MTIIQLIIYIIWLKMEINKNIILWQNLKKLLKAKDIL